MLAVDGLASGLDTGAIISQLMEIERQPIIQLQSREAAFQVQLSTYGTFQSLLEDLNAAAKDLKTASNLTGFTATSSDEALFTASASNTASPGSFDVTVTQLAQSQALRSNGFTNTSVLLGEGTLHIQVGSGSVTDVDIGADATLQDVATEINDSTAGVNATIIFDGSDYFLTLSPDASGTGNLINLTVTDVDGDHTDTSGLSQITYETAGIKHLTEVRTALDATIDVDGIVNITRSSNTITDVIPGVTLELLTAPDAPDNAATMSVTRNSGNLREKLQGLFDAYNALQDFFIKEQAFDESTGTAGGLLGDRTANIIRRGLSTFIPTTLSGFGPALNSMADVGIGTDAAGKLEFTSDTLLDDALSVSPNAVIDLFTKNEGNTKGFAVQFVEVLDNFLEAETGTLTSRQTGINRSIKDIKDNIESGETRLGRTQQRLESQFLALEATMSQLLSTQSFLSQQLASLNNLNLSIANRRR